MYWSAVLQQLTAIIVAMSYTENTFACFSNSGFCSCPTKSAGCSCSQHLPLQSKTFIAPSAPLNLPPFHHLIPSSSYSARYPPYLPHQPIPPGKISHPQKYNFPHTSFYNAPQISQKSVLMPLSSYNSQRSIGIIGTSGNYYPLPYNVYEIRSQKLPPYTIAKIPSVSETQRHSSQQIEVAPSIISSEHITHANEMTTQQHATIPTAATLVAQNIIVVPRPQHTTTPPNNSLATIVFKRNNATEMNERNATAMQQHRFTTNQNYRSMGDSRRRAAGRRLSLCSRNISKSENHNNILIECNGLLRRTNGLNENSGRIEVHALNGKRFESDSILNGRRINVPSVRSGIRTMSQTQLLKHFKSTDVLPFQLQKNQLLQKEQNSKIGENISQKAVIINLTGTERHVSQNRKTAFGKPTFKEVLSGNWMERNDKLLNRAFGRTKGLHNLTKWIDYDNFYTTHHHQSCVGQILGNLRNGTIMSVAQKCEELQCDATNVKLSDDHILEITFLKNITGRYRNYGNYCVSKKSIGKISSGNVIFGTNTLSQAQRFYNRSNQQSYSRNREVNK